uniref:Uncharacterized protein n=1 Tax=Brugia malayi TaxID=6279 RepID=A8NJV1_BRUMA
MHITSSSQANIIAWSSSCGHLSLPAANLHPLPMKAG